MTKQPVPVDDDFDDDPAETLPPSYTFRLGGRVWRVKHSDNIGLDVLTSAFTGSGVQSAVFFRGVLVDEDVPEFEKMLFNPPAGVTLGRVRKATAKVAEKVLGFPTTPDSGSPEPSSVTPGSPKSSRARSSSPGTRRRASGE